MTKSPWNLATLESQKLADPKLEREPDVPQPYLKLVSRHRDPDRQGSDRLLALPLRRNNFGH